MRRAQLASSLLGARGRRGGCLARVALASWSRSWSRIQQEEAVRARVRSLRFEPSGWDPAGGERESQGCQRLLSCSIWGKRAEVQSRVPRRGEGVARWRLRYIIRSQSPWHASSALLCSTRSSNSPEHVLPDGPRQPFGLPILENAQCRRLLPPETLFKPLEGSGVSFRKSRLSLGLSGCLCRGRGGFGCWGVEGRAG